MKDLKDGVVVVEKVWGDVMRLLEGTVRGREVGRGEVELRESAIRCDSETLTGISS